MKTSKLICYFLAMVCIFTSCEKDDNCQIGNTGPQGPPGASGIIEITTKEITILASQWQPYNTSTNNNDSAAVTIQEITQSIVDSGMVICYRKVGNNYMIMPNSNFDGLAELVFQYYYYKEKLVITCNANYVGGPNPGTETFRVVIASGHLRSAGKKIDWNNYENVVNLFTISPSLP